MEMHSTGSWVFLDSSKGQRHDDALCKAADYNSCITYCQLYGTNMATAYNLEFNLAANA